MSAVVAARSSVSPLVTRSWKAPIALGFFALLAVVLFVLLGRDGTSTFRLAVGTDFFALPDLLFPSRATGVVVAVLTVALAAASAVVVRARRRISLWFPALFALVFLIGFLVWASAGATLPVPGLLLGTVGLATPLVFGSLGGVISERVGVVNVAIEGQLLAGAFTAAVVSSLTRQPVLGVLAAMVASVLVSLVLAVFAITYLVDQVIVGIVLNVLVTGLTSFLSSQVLSVAANTVNSPVKFDRLPIPMVSQIPLVGAVLFDQTVIVYLMYIAIAAVWWGLYMTKWGLRLRAVGEHPQAADSVGINVPRTRFWNVSFAGAIAGIGGAYYTLDAVGAFNKEMTAGAGFIALAAVIFGRWDPIRATLASLLFGFATNLQNTLSLIGSPVPSEFMLMLPYLVTIFAVVGLVGQSRGPAAAGKPYVKS
ncbi:ABC transporter permease [Rathayibacter toxicus]|uniref:ABC transporter permease n=1 Tax=Rathayibacter toxicus TaxID=145458 RepID=A0A0C5BB16_9MICO|nr:ABC transporter permease [Rathayibacter toxicus]AJM78038.1 ABC transporter permease [Rathayibacter toxicus]ALS57729.1 ABC transporter permease [Rathayibacter toxicus]KKM47312.1 ABC transporter permease [Rathayibacter toxicus]PPG20598.1 ABC transporter permease [Rathayibacter toxicus]PPG45701.1 ABC transporter permease [Rathayibacter toxicus]